MIRVRRLTVREFLDAASAFMTAREALHNLPAAVARHVADDPLRYPHANDFLVVEDGARVVGIALRTPPHRLQAYVPSGEAVTALCDHFAERGVELPGVHGPEAPARQFAAAWAARRGSTATVRMRLRAFELTTVVQPPQPTGRFRRAEERDLPFVEASYRAFHDEAHAMAGGAAPEDVGRRALADGRTYLWDDGGPAAMAAMTGSTANGARVGAVYTPPANRRRGYATALVAALSQHLLDGGRRFCFLFTDLANPVSNSIYPKVGYRPVADFADIDFGGPSADAGPTAATAGGPPSDPPSRRRPA